MSLCFSEDDPPERPPKRFSERRAATDGPSRPVSRQSSHVSFPDQPPLPPKREWVQPRYDVDGSPQCPAAASSILRSASTAQDFGDSYQWCQLVTRNFGPRKYLLTDSVIGRSDHKVLDTYRLAYLLILYLLPFPIVFLDKISLLRYVINSFRC